MLASARTSWSDDIFNVNYTGSLQVTMTDCCTKAILVSLDDNGSKRITGWTLLATTDQVMTGPNLNASTYYPFWTGIGIS